MEPMHLQITNKIRRKSHDLGHTEYYFYSIRINSGFAKSEMGVFVGVWQRLQIRNDNYPSCVIHNRNTHSDEKRVLVANPSPFIFSNYFSCSLLPNRTHFFRQTLCAAREPEKVKQ